MRVSTAVEEGNVKLSPTPNSNSHAKLLAEGQVYAFPGIKSICHSSTVLDKVSGFQQKIMRHTKRLEKNNTLSKNKGIDRSRLRYDRDVRTT